MDIKFMQDFVVNTVDGMKVAQIRMMTYRDGKVEISPGNLVNCFIPDRLIDHKRTITIDGVQKEISVKGILNNGDMVAVAKLTDNRGYLILEKVNA